MSSLIRIARTRLTQTRTKAFARPSASIIHTQKSFAVRGNNSIFTSTTTRSPRTSSRPFTTSTTKMGVHNIASKQEFSTALKNEVVVLDCFATWCGPCKVIAPQVVKFSEEFSTAHFIKVDVDEVPDVAQELGIRAMPTFIVFKGGEKVAEVVGANPPALRAAIEKAVNA